MTVLKTNNNQVGAVTRPFKLNPPEVGNYFVRPSLVDKLSRIIASPGKVWISSPGGAGKTALVRNTLVKEARPFYWYQVDSEDQDPASLFIYLAQAVENESTERTSLPVLEPEYLQSFDVFCANFCRALIEKIEVPCVFVFDDLQEGQSETLFGPFLSALMAALPATSSLILISREEPYSRFARDRMNRTLSYLGWDDLRLSADETRSFLNWSKQKELSRQVSDNAYSLTQGWLAGLLLYHDMPNIEGAMGLCFDERADLLFDYFAGEVFEQTDEAEREFLLLCSLLPSIDVSLVNILTGRPDADDVLNGMVRRNNFTYRITSDSDAYRFHPLFRQFLHSKARRILGDKECALKLDQAAKLLLKDCRSEYAAELMIEAKSWASLTELVLSEAEGLLRQGRSQTLLQWLQAIPVESRETNPWLCYWHGICLLASHPAVALQELTKAFELFDPVQDAVGSMLSWSMAVNAIVIAWDDYVVLDQWIERFDHLRDCYKDYPSLEIESLMVQGICKALAWRYPERDDLPRWADHLYRLVINSRESYFRLLAGSNLVLYHLVSGDISTAKSLVNILNSDLHSSEVGPLKKLVWLSTRAALEWVLLNRHDCLATIEKGQSIIEASGVHVMDIRLYAQGITLALSVGDVELARRLFEELPENPITSSFDHAHYSLLQANLSLLEGDVEKAVIMADASRNIATERGNEVIKAMSLCILTIALYQSGEYERSSNILEEGLMVTRGMSLFRCSLLFHAAHAALENENMDAARSQLLEGFGLAAEKGYLNFFAWNNSVMIRLCREAIEASIEVKYVKRLLDKHGLNKEQLDQPQLTPKEREALGWVQEGKTTWEIARIMDISEATVKFHVRNILRKFDAGSRAQAVAIALKSGLLAERNKISE